MSALVIRPIGPDEIELFTAFADASPLGLKPPLGMYLDGLHQWYRPEWSWVALGDGQVVARVAFNGPPDAKLPLAMGSLEIGTRPDRVETGLALVRTAYGAMTGGGTGEGGRPEYRQFLPVDWQSTPACGPRSTTGEPSPAWPGCGSWSSGWSWAGPRSPGGAAAAARRLRFRPVGDDAEVLAVVRGTLEGTLDAHARRDVARDGVDTAARAIVEELPGPGSLVRLAYDPAGSCVGITVPGLRPGELTSPMSACSPSTEATATPRSCCWRPATCWSRVGPPRSWPPPMWATHPWRRRSRAAGTWWSTG